MRKIGISRETLLQRMRRHYTKQRAKMTRAGKGKFLILRNNQIIDEFYGSEVEKKAQSIGVLNEYEFEQSNE